MRLAVLWAVLAACLLCSAPTAAHHRAGRIPDLVYIPTPPDVAAEMLRLAGLRRNDRLYDLGCGDGRIVVTAARQSGCHAVGVDINPLRVEEAQRNVRENKLEDLVTIRREDLFQTDLRQATVVVLYLSTKHNTKLVPRLNQMQPGSRIVSHQFAVEGIPPQRTIQYKSKDDGRTHTLHFWTTPLTR